MKNVIKEEIQQLIKKLDLNCSIEEFRDKVDWTYISQYQKLSEGFIREFKDKVNWKYIAFSQKLSEEFIKEFRDKVNWEYISQFQKLNEGFIKEFNLSIPKNNWLYTSKKTKLKHLKESNKYEIIDNNYIIAYKGIRSDGYSKYNFRYKYEVGKVYEDFHCDCNLSNENSFGLGVWTLEKAREYCSEKVFKVRVNIEDIGAIVHENDKIRCWRLEVIEEIK